MSTENEMTYVHFHHNSPRRSRLKPFFIYLFVLPNLKMGGCTFYHCSRAAGPTRENFLREGSLLQAFAPEMNAEAEHQRHDDFLKLHHFFFLSSFEPLIYLG